MHCPESGRALCFIASDLMKLRVSLLALLVGVIGLQTSSRAADLVVSEGTSAKNESGITFQVENTNRDAIIRLRGVFLLATDGGEPQEFVWYCADGNEGFVDGMFGMPIQGGPAWKRLASVKPPAVEDSDEPGNPQTLLQFDASLEIRPGQTVTIAIVQSSLRKKTIKFATKEVTTGAVDGLVFRPYRGLGSAPGKQQPESTNLSSPGFNLQQFGTGAQVPGQSRSFIGRVNYILVPQTGG